MTNRCMLFRGYVQATKGVGPGPENSIAVGDEGEEPNPGSGWAEVTDLSFDGRRFSDHAVELEVTKELVAFQQIVSDLAADLWRKDNPNRERLPRGFDRTTRLRFRTIREGSSRLPLEAPVESEESLWGPSVSPYVSAAVDLVVEAVKSQEDGSELPAAFPRDGIVALLAQWGSTLSDDESITISEVQRQRVTAEPKQARFNLNTRRNFARYAESVYEDTVTLYGEVRAVDRDKSNSQIRLPNQSRITVRFGASFEESFAQALNSSAVIALTGLARISRIDGYVQQMTSVTEFVEVPLAEQTKDELGDWLDEVSKTVDWSVVPSDYGRNADRYLYREGKG